MNILTIISRDLFQSRNPNKNSFWYGFFKIFPFLGCIGVSIFWTAGIRGVMIEIIISVFLAAIIGLFTNLLLDDRSISFIFAAFIFLCLGSAVLYLNGIIAWYLVVIAAIPALASITIAVAVAMLIKYCFKAEYSDDSDPSLDVELPRIIEKEEAAGPYLTYPKRPGSLEYSSLVVFICALILLMLLLIASLK